MLPANGDKCRVSIFFASSLRRRRTQVHLFKSNCSNLIRLKTFSQFISLSDKIPSRIFVLKLERDISIYSILTNQIDDRSTVTISIHKMKKSFVICQLANVIEFENFICVQVHTHRRRMKEKQNQFQSINGRSSISIWCEQFFYLYSATWKRTQFWIALIFYFTKKVFLKNQDIWWPSNMNRGISMFFLIHLSHPKLHLLQATHKKSTQLILTAWQWKIGSLHTCDRPFRIYFITNSFVFKKESFILSRPNTLLDFFLRFFFLIFF